MTNARLIGSWIRRFLMEHVCSERNLSRNIQASYRDTMVLLLPFVGGKEGKSVDQLTVDDLSAETIRLFLQHLEQDRHCSIATRNQRLAAIHGLARFIAQSPEYISWCTEIRSIPFKKTAKPVMAYLDKPEMDALLDAPDRQTNEGARDYAILLFLYNTGARADEAAHVKVGDLDLGRSFQSVKIHGKGGKIRYCPLWSLTVTVLSTLVAGRASTDRVFLNCRKQPMTRFGIHALVKRYVVKASAKLASLTTKRVSAHTIRHATAVHLLRAGVDLNTIRAWLGHVSLDTTHVYAEIDLEMKAKALAHCEILVPTQANKSWKDNPMLMSFLRNL
jgi:integrase/recombinase XerD